MKIEKHQCEERITSDWGHSHQCYNSASIQRNGKWYCKTHDPERIKQKNEERQKKWEAEWAEKEKQHHRRRIIQDLTDGFSAEILSKHSSAIREFIQGLNTNSK